MQKAGLLLLVLSMLVGFSGCETENPADVKVDIKPVEEPDTNDILNRLQQGGQPGYIKVSGIIVQENSALDERINIVLKAGLNKDGSRAKVLEANQPMLTSSPKEIDLSGAVEQKTLIALGCDEKLVSDLAKERSLEVRAVPAPVAKDVLTIAATTIVLCGDLGRIKVGSSALSVSQFLTFNADELILDRVNYALSGLVGELDLNANKIVLVGANRLGTKGMASFATPELHLNVLKAIDSNDNGQLLLTSEGSDSEALAK